MPEFWLIKIFKLATFDGFRETGIIPEKISGKGIDTWVTFTSALRCSSVTVNLPSEIDSAKDPVSTLPVPCGALH